MLKSKINHDGDEIEARAREYPIGSQQFMVRCGMCGAVYYVDADFCDRVNAAIRDGLDSPFRCDDCSEEYDEMVYEG